MKPRRKKLLAGGWASVTILPRGAFFSKWDYDPAAKKDGGEAFIEVRHSGEVAVHKGYAPRKKTTANKDKTSAGRTECSAPMENYVDLHRHAAARATLLGRQQIALRLLAAHLIVGAPNLRSAPDPQRTKNEVVAASLAASKGQAVFEQERAEIAKLLEMDEPASIAGGNGDGWRLAETFARLMKLADDDIARILTFIITEALAVGHDAIDCIACVTPIDIGAWMAPDDAFFELLRDRRIANTMLRDIAGSEVASANAGEPLKVQKAIIRDCLEGRNGRERAPDWRPRWLGFPALSYGDAGKPGAVRRAEAIAPLFAR